MALAYYKHINKTEQIADTLERLIALAVDHEAMEPYIIEFADLEFDREHYPEAEVLYEKYAYLYPGGKKIHYMTYRSLLALHHQLQPAERELSLIKKLLTRAESFLAKTNIPEKYVTAATDLKKLALGLLCEGELHRAGFYIQRHSYTGKINALYAAAQHIQSVEENFLSQLELDPADQNYIKALAALKKINAKKFTLILPEDEKKRAAFVTALQNALQSLEVVVTAYQKTLKNKTPKLGWLW